MSFLGAIILSQLTKSMYLNEVSDSLRRKNTVSLDQL